jgi:hypothetical protein
MQSFFEWVFPNMKPACIGFEDVIHAIRTPDRFVLINTLPLDQQSCLIKGTLYAREEEAFVNDCLTKYNANPRRIVLYGKHTCDDTPYRKQRQLLSLGISETCVYAGGMFEWLLLQDIYGKEEFATVGSEGKVDLLSWAPARHFS